MCKVGVSANALSKSRTDDEANMEDLNTKQSNAPKPAMSNGHLDHRLTKATPLKSTILKTNQLQTPVTQTEVNAPPMHAMSRLNLLNAGKATPFKQAVIKTFGDYVVKVTSRIHLQFYTI